MNPEQAMGLFQFLLTNIESETKITRKVLAAVPDDKGDYTPDPTSMTALTLASHLATAELWFANGVITSTFAASEDGGVKFNSASEVLAYYDKEMPEAIERLKGLSAEHLATPVPFFHMTMPAVIYLNFMLMHSAHHRGQLSAYLRPMGAKVPSIYGGSADEPFEAAAQA
jgi:uncharacterized damage-inducible protein DinB